LQLSFLEIDEVWFAYIDQLLNFLLPSCAVQPPHIPGHDLIGIDQIIHSKE
jgi:hypothetical protein